MNSEIKTNQELLEEISVLKQRIQGLEKSGSEGKQKTDEGISQGEKKYREFANALPQIAYEIDKIARFTFVNRASLSMTGYTEEDFKTITAPEVAVPVDRERLKESIQKLLRGETTAGNEYLLQRKDGTTFAAIFYSMPVIKENKIVGIRGFGFDITERRRVEEALRESEERYRNLFENANEAIFVVLDGYLVFLNPMAAVLCGYSSEELMSRPYIEIVHPDDRNMILDRHSRRIKGEEFPHFYSFRIIRKDSCVKWVKLSTVLINWKGREATLNFLTDITEHKRAQDALRDSEERYRLLAENAMDVIWTVDMDMKMTYVSLSITRHLGFTADEAMVRSMQQAFTPTAFEKAMQIFAEEMEIESTGRGDPTRSRVIELELVHKDGNHIPFEANFCFLRDATGKATGMLSIARNVNERKQLEVEKQRLEERLARSEKMEALGILAGGVAHDLNNVMGAIIGYAEILLMNAETPNASRPKLVNIMKGGQKAAAIVDDLLTLARRGVSYRKVVNLNTIIADNQQSPEFEKLYSYHPSVKFETDLEPDLLNISGSSVHLGKSLFNLASNAAEAMPKGGILKVKTTNQYLERPIQGYDEVREGDYAVLSVSDTGDGIRAADMKHIFEPFYTKKVMGRSGTGLGLSVVWDTVKDHHGYINVESEERSGSIFTLYFPITREDVSSEAGAVAIAEYAGGGESVLVVDDVREQRDLAADMLKTLNYNVSIVSSGEEALAHLKEHHVDLMVLDMIMDPGMDGLDTYKSVLEIHPKQKAIIVSGFSESDRVSEALSLGAGAYIRKPYVIEKLGTAVRKELNRT